MSEQKTVLVFGGTGQTGQHFVRLALQDGFRVRALARNPAKFAIADPNLEVVQGSITDIADLDALVAGTDFIVSMLGDAASQREHPIVTDLVRKLVPAMRRHGVSRFLHQAGGLSARPHRRLPPILWLIRHTDCPQPRRTTPGQRGRHAISRRRGERHRVDGASRRDRIRWSVARCSRAIGASDQYRYVPGLRRVQPAHGAGCDGRSHLRRKPVLEAVIAWSVERRCPDPETDVFLGTASDREPKSQ